MLTAPAKPRRLKFYNLHTSEQLDIVYYEKGRYIPQALAEINYILRDYRQNVVKPIASGAARPRGRNPAQAPYRRRSSDYLRLSHAADQRDAGGAQRRRRASQPAHGRTGARLARPGRTLEELHRVALAMRGGGVGYYPASDFVHTDVGRVRYW